MDFVSTLVGVLVFLAIIIVALAIERLAPAQKQPAGASAFNLIYTALYMLAQALIAPGVSIVTVAAVNAAGGGWIALPGSGWGLALSFIAYTLAADLMEYLFHRAQHRFPAMWAMHSFHHSDTVLNASTTNRHFWLEEALKMVTIHLLIGLLFKTPRVVLGMYAVASIYNVFLHMNIRIGFGRGSGIINSPQYHRVHHSCLPEHFDCNFAAIFTIWDVIFGTYHKPQPEEYPPTGLDTGDEPKRLADAVIWPLRSLRAARVTQ
jgi:sterol desaturase/sphingolipid hydroxylase (fatty acid hydroxylase superfamily)